MAMNPRWKVGNVMSPRYECVAQIWEADIWKKVEPDETHFNWGVVLSNDHEDQFWFDDVEAVFTMFESRWLGHFPDGFDDKLRAAVALLDS